MRFASEASLPVRVCACACGPFFGSPHRVGVRVFVCLHCRPALEQLALLPVTVAATSVSSSSSSASSSSSRYRRGPLRSSDLSRTRRAAQQVRTAFVFLCVCVCVCLCVSVLGMQRLLLTLCPCALPVPSSLSLALPCRFPCRGCAVCRTRHSTSGCGRRAHASTAPLWRFCRSGSSGLSTSTRADSGWSGVLLSWVGEGSRG